MFSDIGGGFFVYIFAQFKINLYLCTVNLRWGCLHNSGGG